MERLFRAYAAALPRAGVISPKIFSLVDTLSKLLLFFEDLVVRNSGDVDVVDHKDEGWSDQLKKHDCFRTDLAKGTGFDRAIRQQEPMNLKR
jgi:hypothetical protein